ncbi:MAG: glycosyltransferase family 2 protein [Clostridium sp.]|nr:glycosyltransferase family 2 protein [Clostridium sp.]
MERSSKISIVVPVYNVESYLKQCLDSLISQTFKDIKIILVNDGSDDNSKIICDEYKKLDDRIIVIDKKNGGLSDARNVGLRYADSEYVGFIDSDDYIDKDFYEKLYEGIIKSNADIAIASIKKVNNFEKTLYISGYPVEGSISRFEAMKSMLSAKGFSNSVCNKLFKRELFKENPFPVGKLYEDEFVTYKIVDKANKIFSVNTSFYYYRVNENGITHKKFSERELDRIQASLIRIDYLNKNDQSLVNDGKRYLMYDCLTTLSKMQRYNSKYDSLILKNIRENLIVYLRGKSSVGAKLFAIMSACSPYLAVYCYNFLKRINGKN